MREQESFIFSKYEFKGTILRLFYNTDDYEFVEEIDFLKECPADKTDIFDVACRYLHLVAGISYYKAFLPKNIFIKTKSINKEQADFFNLLYFNGLGEFSYRNNFLLNINFPFINKGDVDVSKIKLKHNIIIPIGGGKDSLVVFELLKKQEQEKTKFYSFVVNPVKTMNDIVDNIGIDSIKITRKISATLLELIKNNNGYNGHVPITAIIAFISVCASIIYDCDTVAIANEKSASIGNIEWQGRLINHQWSKSEEAEKQINSFIGKYILPFNYYSPIRNFYEIAIAKKFSEMKKYHSIFSSCNKNFKITADKKNKTWCCNCPKCCFVFLILSPFLKKQEIVNIFGKNMFDDSTQLDNFEELVGLRGCKPFECVGEIEESILAFLLLKNTEFKNDIIVRKIVNRLNNYDLESLKIKYLGEVL
jgi:hypothetical protein